jgi:hypothetical protein
VAGRVSDTRQLFAVDTHTGRAAEIGSGKRGYHDVSASLAGDEIVAIYSDQSLRKPLEVGEGPVRLDAVLLTKR